MSIRVGIMKNRRAQIWIGVALFIVGSFLLYDAYNRQGRSMKWPFSGIAPF